MSFFKLWILVLLPTYLAAGIFDWFYTSPKQVTQFECPHHCGKWGTEGVRQVEWEAVLALWELDRLGHALKEKEFSYETFPKDMDDRWYRNFYNNGVTLCIDCVTREVHESFFSGRYIDFKKESKTLSVCDSIDIYHYKDDVGELKGSEFSLQSYYLKNGEYQEFKDSEYYEAIFDSYNEIKNFCSSPSFLVILKRTYLLLIFNNLQTNFCYPNS